MDPTLEGFARRHRHLSQGDFLALVTGPHLVLRYLAAPPGPVGETFRTVRVQPGQAAVMRGDRLLLPIVKRPQANVFAMMITIGRAPNNDIVLTDARVSKLQAYFCHRDGAWQVWDPVSTNGTLVDGVPVPRTAGRALHSMSMIEFTGAAESSFVLPHDLYRLIAAPETHPAPAPG